MGAPLAWSKEKDCMQRVGARVLGAFALLIVTAVQAKAVLIIDNFTQQTGWTFSGGIHEDDITISGISSKRRVSVPFNQGPETGFASLNDAGTLIMGGVTQISNGLSASLEYDTFGSPIAFGANKIIQYKFAMSEAGPTYPNGPQSVVTLTDIHGNVISKAITFNHSLSPFLVSYDFSGEAGFDFQQVTSLKATWFVPFLVDPFSDGNFRLVLNEVSAVPEPATLLAAGAGVALLLRRRRSAKSAAGD